MLLVKIVLFTWAVTVVISVIFGMYLNSLEGKHKLNWLAKEYTKGEYFWLIVLSVLLLLDIMGFLYIVFWFLFLR